MLPLYCRTECIWAMLFATKSRGRLLHTPNIANSIASNHDCKKCPLSMEHVQPLRTESSRDYVSRASIAIEAMSLNMETTKQYKSQNWKKFKWNWNWITENGITVELTSQSISRTSHSTSTSKQIDRDRVEIDWWMVPSRKTHRTPFYRRTPRQRPRSRWYINQHHTSPSHPVCDTSHPLLRRCAHAKDHQWDFLVDSSWLVLPLLFYGRMIDSKPTDFVGLTPVTEGCRMSTSLSSLSNLLTPCTI